MFKASTSSLPLHDDISGILLYHHHSVTNSGYTRISYLFDRCTCTLWLTSAKANAISEADAHAGALSFARPSLPSAIAGRPTDTQADRQELTFARRSLPSFDKGRTREAWRTKNTSTRQAMRSVRADTKEGT
jgi:hypothetical protein